MKLTKKHALLISGLAILMALCTIAGATLAYLFVKTDSVENTFSPSNIGLTLEETNVDGNSATENSYQMIPGETIAKDPKVTVTADVDCYVFVKVEKANEFDTYMTYAPAAGWDLVDGTDNVYYRTVTATAAKDGESFYVLAGDTANPNGIVTVRNTVIKDQMDALKTAGTGSYPTLTFTAYAIQKDGFDDAAAAWPYALAQSNTP